MMSNSKKFRPEKQTSCVQLNSCKNNTYPSPKSLHHICICFIAINIHMVESLLGFPDIVGLNIFHRAEEIGKFKASDKMCLSALHLFCESYEELVLSSLSVTGNHLCFNNFYEIIVLFKHLNKLDISCNYVGDNHDILYHISQLNRLETLCLSKNSLSDDGIRKMTSPIRMLNRGPLNLQNLDISENIDVSSKCVRYLKCFKQLKILDLSNTSVKEISITEDLKIMNLVLLSSDININYVFDIKTEGWAKQLIKRWKLTSLEQPEIKTQLSCYGTFYTKKKTLNRDEHTHNKKQHNLIFVTSSIQKVPETKPIQLSVTSVEKESLESTEDDEMKRLYKMSGSETKQLSLSSLMDYW